ncbi:hypothetical protein [Saccharibacillus deserti]|uniref:hypothetical protein n=1 Tax=Saccharibacillus deserti TaxID=1634444 RepID=UPI001552D4B2|nr:hypothetical protein [Saccharibacillus deserti]
MFCFSSKMKVTDAVKAVLSDKLINEVARYVKQNLVNELTTCRLDFKISIQDDWLVVTSIHCKDTIYKERLCTDSALFQEIKLKKELDISILDNVVYTTFIIW